MSSAKRFISSAISSAGLVFAFLGVLPFVTVAAGAQSEESVPPGDLVAPVERGRLVPCCDNEAELDPEWKSLRERRRVPDHFHLDAETLAERRAKALLDPPDVPARRLGGAPLKNFTAKTPQLRTQFEGLNAVEAGHRGTVGFPPDTIVAASPSRVLEGSNVALRLSDRAGNPIRTKSLNNFFAAPFPPVLFDPKVYFDRLSERFFIVALSVDFDRRRSRIHLSVSRGPDPRTLEAPRDWCTYDIPGNIGASWADYPGLGMNEKWLAISVNNFNFVGPFRAVYITALDKRRLAANADGCPGIDFHRFKAAQDGHGGISFTVQPAQHYSPGAPLYFVSSDSSEAISDRYTLWRMVEVDGEPRLGRAPVTGAQLYSFPPAAPQSAGLELDTGDLRVQQVAYRNGLVWAVHNTGCNFGPLPGESCARVVGIRPREDGGGDVTFEENFGGGSGWYVWMPGVAVNARGDVVVAFQRSRGNMSIGTAYAGKRAESANFEALRKVVNGRCVLDHFDGNVNRSGDYVGVQADPADDLGFWIAGEYSGNVPGLGCDWRTRVFRVAY